MDIRSRQPSGRVPDRPRKPRHLGKAAGTREGIAGRPDRPFDGYPCLGSLALASGPDPADEQTLALVGVCVNRIGKEPTSWQALRPIIMEGIQRDVIDDLRSAKILDDSSNPSFG